MVAASREGERLMGNRDGLGDDIAQTVERATAELVDGRFDTIHRLFAAIDSPRPVLRWLPDERDLVSPHLTFLHGFWRQRSRDGDLPLSEAIDALALRSALGFVMLLEPVDGGADFRYRVYGSAIAARSGLELTGKLVSAVPAPLVAAYFLATYRAVLVRRCPLLARHTTHHDIQVTQWDRLILPFVDRDERVHRLLVGNIPGERTL